MKTLQIPIVVNDVTTLPNPVYYKSGNNEFLRISQESLHITVDKLTRHDVGWSFIPACPIPYISPGMERISLMEYSLAFNHYQDYVILKSNELEKESQIEADILAINGITNAAKFGREEV